LPANHIDLFVDAMASLDDETDFDDAMVALESLTLDSSVENKQAVVKTLSEIFHDAT
jgi:hypothetical protein